MPNSDLCNIDRYTKCIPTESPWMADNTRDVSMASDEKPEPAPPDLGEDFLYSSGACGGVGYAEALPPGPSQGKPVMAV